MQDFSSISVSSYEAGSLAERLSEQSRDGWHVVAIVPTGSTVTAYLCREADGAAPVVAPSPEPAADEHEAAHEPAATESIPEPTLAAISSEPPAEPAPEPELELAPEAEAEPAPEPELAPEAEAAAAATTAGAAPAGWYADPSGRFELRYWDGGQWTEHVSRAGQQYTDPPVA